MYMYINFTVGTLIRFYCEDSSELLFCLSRSPGSLMSLWMAQSSRGRHLYKSLILSHSDTYITFGLVLVIGISTFNTLFDSSIFAGSFLFKCHLIILSMLPDSLNYTKCWMLCVFNSHCSSAD